MFFSAFLSLLSQDAITRMKDYGIQPNDVENGIWLPRPGVDSNNQNSSAVGIIHSGRHPNIYVREVNRRILLVPEGLPTDVGRQQIITIIDNLKNKLYNSAETGGDWYNVLNEDNENDL